MCWKIIEVIAEVLAGIGTVFVAIFAIWGDFFRYKLAGPQLALSLNNPRGDLTTRLNQTRTYYFLVKVKNRRLWSPARDVRVLLERIARRRPDNSFFVEPLVYPLPLIWTPMELGDFQRTIADTEICDLGCLDENANGFMLATIIKPNNFNGEVLENEAMRVRLVASGQNVTSSKPLFIEIAWDGVWTTDKDDIQKHLVVKEIPAL